MSDEAPPDVLTVRLDPQSLDDLAHRVADLVHQQLDTGAAAENDHAPRDTGRLLSAAQVAARWGVDRPWVYAHADQLGAMRLGSGLRPRLRFDPGRVAAYLNASERGPATRPNTTPAWRSGGSVRRSPRITSDCAKGLPFRPDPELSSNHQPRRPGGAETPPATAPETEASAR